MTIRLLSTCLAFLVSFFPYLVQAQSDLAVIPTVLNQVSAGRNLTYTIVVVNNGPGSADGVSLRDTLPPGTTFVSLTLPAGWNATTPAAGSNAPIEATIPTLPSGAIQILTLVVNVVGNLPIGSQLINRPVISCASPDPNLSNNQFLVLTIVGIPPAHDLAVINRGHPILNVDANAVYAIQVANIGLEPQSFVSFADILPSGTTFLSLAAPVGWTVTTPPVGSNGIIVASVPTLAPGAVAAFVLGVKTGTNVPPGNSLLNVASVTGATADLNFPNNISSVTTRIISPLPGDVSVITTGPETANAGSNINYTITVRNNGPNDVQNVNLTDILQGLLTFVSIAVPPGWTISTPPIGSGGLITATVPQLGNGSSATFTLVARVAENIPGFTTVTNIASVTSGNTDPVSNNNSSNATTSILPPLSTDLSVIKTGPATVNAGDNITYNITVRNNGPIAAQNVRLTDGLPPHLTFASLSAAPGWEISTPPVGSSGLITASIPQLPSGSSATFTLGVKLAESLPAQPNISNTASVNSSSFDPVPNNNFSQAISTLPCTLICPANITGYVRPGGCGLVVNFPFPTISGGCGPVTVTPASGSFFPIGTTTVRVNSTTGQTCSFTVTVKDTLPPTITSCPAPQTFCFTNSGTYSIPKLVAGDNCGEASITYAISGATNRTGVGDNASGQFNNGTSTITWTVRDSSNNSSSCQTNVTISSPLTVSIPDASSIGTGVNLNTIYPGYAPASTIELIAKASGGTLPYTYSWSNGATTASIRVGPSTPTTYVVTVTDALGCKVVSAEKSVKVVDVKCGEKVEVCIVPPGKFSNPFSSCVYASVVPSLLSTGSRLGSCNTPEDYSLSLEAMPNPSSSFFTLNIKTNNANVGITLSIYSITGRLVENRRVNANSRIQVGASYSQGVYLVEALQGAKKATLVLIKL